MVRFGNYENLYPPQQTLDSLEKLLAWKCDIRGMDPVGQGFIVSATIDIISGHRDAPGSSTACPGDSLYAMLPDVRIGTKALMDACDLTPAKPAAFCALRESATEARIIVEQDTMSIVTWK